jgi:hypothetical protein
MQNGRNQLDKVPHVTGQQDLPSWRKRVEPGILLDRGRVMADGHVGSVRRLTVLGKTATRPRWANRPHRDEYGGRRAGYLGADGRIWLSARLGA